MSEALREHLARLLRRATGRGFGPSFRETVRSILDDLRQDPRGAGDPVRRLRGMAMTEYRLFRERLVVSYSIHDRIPMVTVWRFVPASGHPLTPPSDNGD